MLSFLDNVSIQYLTVIAVMMALAPFQPEPHLVEKFRMLRQGALVRPIDIFDFIMHLTPAIILLLKIIRVYSLKN